MVRLQPGIPLKKIMHELFRKIAHKASEAVGSAPGFVIAVMIVLAWAVSGPLFDFSNTWQLFINSFTTILTFLMVFLIQNTQNRDAKAIHLKLDELIKAIKGAGDELIDVEEMTDEELDKLEKKYRKIHEKVVRRKNVKV